MFYCSSDTKELFSLFFNHLYQQFGKFNLFELFFPPNSYWELSTVIVTLLKIKMMTFYWRPWTYPNKGPVTKVVDGAEEPELVEEKIGPGHNALVWKGQRKHKNILLNRAVINVYFYMKFLLYSTQDGWLIVEHILNPIRYFSSSYLFHSDATFWHFHFSLWHLSCRQREKIFH